MCGPSDLRTGKKTVDDVMIADYTLHPSPQLLSSPMNLGSLIRRYSGDWYICNTVRTTRSADFHKTLSCLTVCGFQGETLDKIGLPY